MSARRLSMLLLCAAMAACSNTDNGGSSQGLVAASEVTDTPEQADGGFSATDVQASLDQLAGLKVVKVTAATATACPAGGSHLMFANGQVLDLCNGTTGTAGAAAPQAALASKARSGPRVILARRVQPVIVARKARRAAWVCWAPWVRSAPPVYPESRAVRTVSKVRLGHWVRSDRMDRPASRVFKAQMASTVPSVWPECRE